jgi:hypothetical protein
MSAATTERSHKMSKTETPTMLSAEEAATALGLDVFDLARALRCFAVDELERVTATVWRGDERPNLGRFQRLLRAAEACEAAWDELAAAVEDGDGDDA